MNQSNHKPVKRNPKSDAQYFEESVLFITSLAKANQRYDGYSYEGDSALKSVINALELNGEIFATPTLIEIALWISDDNQQKIYITVMKKPNYDMDKLDQIRNLINQVVDGHILPFEGLERLHEIEGAPVVYSNLMKAMAFVLSGVGFAVIIGASCLDVFLGACWA